ELHVLAGQGRLEDAGRLALQLAAIDVDRALRPLERATRRPAVEHDHARGVDELAAGVALPRRLDRDRPGAVRAQRPLGDVEVVGAHVGQAAPGVLAVVAPGGEVLVDAPGAEHGAVLALGGWAQPHLPVGPLRRLFARQLARGGRAADADLHRLD